MRMNGMVMGVVAGVLAICATAMDTAAQCDPASLFGPGQLFDAGFDPESVAIDDFNGDGIPDLAITNHSGSSAGVSVLLGNGDGTFQPHVFYFVFGLSSFAVATGDLNGDGIPDLAIGVYSDTFVVENYVQVFLGNGDGTFRRDIYLDVRTFPRGIIIRDVNGDGFADLVVARRFDFIGRRSLSVLLGNGDGTFQPRRDFTVTDFDDPSSIAVGDLDGDGILDIAITEFFSNTVKMILGNGDGTFQPPQAFDTGDGPRSIAIGDLNGDGIQDLAITNQQSNSISVLLGYGDGTFQPRQDFTTGNRPQSIAIGDLNGDGILDLAVAASFPDNTVNVLLGNGDGTFQPRQDFAAGSFPTAVAIDDFDGDGRLDIVVVNTNSHNISVLLNQCQPCRADIDGDGLLTIFDFLAFQNLFAMGDLAADFDGDGQLTIFDFLAFQNEFALGCP